MEQNRMDRVEACKENLALFRYGPWRLYDIITGDESWFYLRQLNDYNDVESQKNHITKLLQSIPKKQYKKHSKSD